jgi:hypothetical protein
MRSQLLVCLFCLSISVSAYPQSTDHLSPEEINAAVSGAPGSGFVYISDMGFTTPSFCKAQMPGLFIYTPVGWLNALSNVAHRQYLQFEPKPEDTLRALTILAQGCASGTVAGPVCESITRVALLSDIAASVVVEAIARRPVTQSWQNGFGATAACSSLVSEFLLSDVQKVRNKKGEFLVATFGGSQPLKVYTVKQKHLKKLGM